MKDIRRKFLLAIGICLIMTVVCTSEIKAEEGPSSADQISPKKTELKTKKEPHFVIIEKNPAPKRELKVKETAPAPLLERVEFKEITPPAPIGLETKGGTVITKPSSYQIGVAVEGEKQTREHRLEQGERFNFGVQQEEAFPLTPSDKKPEIKAEIGEAQPLAPSSQNWEIKAEIGEAQPLAPVDVKKKNLRTGIKVKKVKLITPGGAAGEATEEIIAPPREKRTTPRERTARLLEKSDKKEE